MCMRGRFRQLTRFQNAEMSYLVMYVTFTNLSITERCVLFLGATALFGENGK